MTRRKRSLRQIAPPLLEQIQKWKRSEKCHRCGLPEGFRDFALSSEGCYHCTEYLKLQSRVEGGREEPRLLELITSLRDRPGAEWDAIVAWSGGKDSSYLLHRFKEVYGLRVLAATVKGVFLSQTAERNIAKGLEALGVDHLWLQPEPRTLEVLQLGFRSATRTGIEADVCDLCDGLTRKRIVETAIERDIPMIVHGADPFQLIDFKLHEAVGPLATADACWPHLARLRGVFRELYEIPQLAMLDEPPREIYPFLFIPYSEAKISAAVRELGIIEEVDPDLTNCKLVFLMNIVELLRRGYPAYVHNTSAAVLQGELPLAEALAEVEQWLGEYVEGRYDDEVFAAFPELGLTLEELIDPTEPLDIETSSVRGGVGSGGASNVPSGTS